MAPACGLLWRHVIAKWQGLYRGVDPIRRQGAGQVAACMEGRHGPASGAEGEGMNNFSWPVDGAIVGVYLLAAMVAGIAVRKYVGKVETFLIAGREMNLYLGIASLAATEFGIVTCMYTAQGGFEKGFAGATPGILSALAMFLVGFTGFCVKPLRDAGVMTIPELFQLRFGSKIRWLSGVVIVLGGLLNMGVFLRVGGDFLINVVGLGAPVDAATTGTGFFASHRLELTMTVLLSAVALYTILGGMLSVLVTDFLQFVVMSAGLIAVTFLVMFHPDLGWSRLVETVSTRYGEGGFNPVVNAQMGWAYILANGFSALAAVLTWQTTIQRLLAAKDTKTGRRVYTRTSFFFMCRWLIPVIWGVAALTLLNPLSFDTKNGTFTTADGTFHTLQAMPMFLNMAVPIGLTGLVIAAMLAADMSTDSSYMLTWGSVIYNDILAPFRKGQWTERRGLLWSRTIVGLIGVFLLFYGLWYKTEGALWDYLVVTGTIYLSSMSTLLVACCYWRYANNWGAGAAIVLGAIVPVSFLVMEKVDVTAAFAKWIGPHWSVIIAFVLAAVAMVVGSLLKVAVKGKEALV